MQLDSQNLDSNTAYIPDHTTTQATTLTRRELFSAMAMQALMTAHPHYAVDGANPTSDEVAEVAVLHADALIRELAALSSP